LIFDDEHAQWVKALSPSWVMTPELIPDESAISTIGIRKDRILKYPGIKEDVYAATFQPSPGLRSRLGLKDHELVVTVRPPATEAHYHNPESEQLLASVLERIAREPAARAVLLPRTSKQADNLRVQWPELFACRKVFIPDNAVDGLELIWTSDLVVSGGGTMNREAAALGVPVYSIFRGKIGAVDRYLADVGRLVLLESVDDVERKITFAARGRSTRKSSDRQALETIVSNINGILQSARQEI
jgi:predicted glycosyltransferase